MGAVEQGPTIPEDLNPGDVLSVVMYQDGPEPVNAFRLRRSSVPVAGAMERDAVAMVRLRHLPRTCRIVATPPAADLEYPVPVKAFIMTSPAAKPKGLRNHMNPLDTYNLILSSLHQAMLDDAHWPATSALIDDACDMSGNELVIAEGSGHDVRILFARYYQRGERRQDLERSYFELYHPWDERLPRLRRLPDGRLVHVTDLYTERELKTSPVYNDGLRHSGAQNGLNVRMDGPHGLRIVWALADSTTGGWQSGQLATVTRLIPHIRQFVQVRQTLAAAEAMGSSLTGLLDNGRIGVVHLDSGGRVIEANARAHRVLRQGDGLFDDGGLLRARLAANNARLQALVGRALPRRADESPRSGSMTVARSPGRPRLVVHVSPVPVRQMDFGARRVAALVLIVDPAGRPRVAARRLGEALGLTPAESRVAARLAEGRPVREIAASEGYQEGYVRWILKQIYRKHGLSGQVALVRLVLAADALPRG